MSKETTAILRALESIGSLVRDLTPSRSKAGTLFQAPKALAGADRRLASLEDTKLRAPTSSRRDQAHRAWEAWKQGIGQLPEPVLLRVLCWEPSIVSDDAFQPCLTTLRPLRSRTIQALLPAYLRLWQIAGEAEPRLARALKEDLAKLDRPRGIVGKWQQAVPELIGTRAAEALATEALRRGVTIASRLGELDLATDTTFARSAAATLLERATSQSDAIERFDWLLNELFPQDASIAGEKGWGSALRNLILNESLVSDARVRERLLDYALGDLRLGDPRVNSVPWHAVGEEATQEVIRWRSSEDLRFFFDLVMKGKPDYQGRHQFWQKYVDGVTRSLIALSDNDKARLHRRLGELEARGRRFANITGTNQVSAFVMEFGETVIVEFSEAGNACYVYAGLKKNTISWQASAVGITTLKNSRSAIVRLIHGQRWEHEFAMALARRGIRPVLGRKPQS